MNNYEIVKRKSAGDIVDRYSRYRNFDILVDNEGREMFETWRNLKIPKTDEDMFHEVRVKDKYRIDLIAHKYYNNQDLWWVIALANNVKDPFFDLEVGEILRIPSISALFGRDGVLY